MIGEAMMTHEAPHRMDGYIRVSRRMGRDGPGYISPAIQREAIQRWAEYKGVQIVAWHEDEDESGGTQERPGLLRAIGRAVNRETGGIVSWKIDRFSRFTEGGLRDLRQLEEAESRLAFVTEDIDTSGPMGKFVYTILLAVSEYVLANIKAGWVAAKERAIERGAKISRAPFGLQRVEDGTITVDADTGPIVTEAFTRSARSGLPAAVDYLRAAAPDHAWTSYTVRRLLANRTYLGEVRYGDQVHNGDHAPTALVSRATFEAAQHEPTGRRRARGDFPLSGIAVCASCGAPMIGGRGGNDARRTYRCSAKCGQSPTISAEPLEAYVIAELREAFDHPGWQVGEAVDTGAAEAALSEAEYELDQFATDVTARRLLRDRYHAAMQARVRAVETARDTLREAMDQARDVRIIQPPEVWETLSPSELGDVLRAALEGVVVRRGRGVSVEDRVMIVLKGHDAPVATA